MLLFSLASSKGAETVCSGELLSFQAVNSRRVLASACTYCYVYLFLRVHAFVWT